MTPKVAEFLVPKFLNGSGVEVAHSPYNHEFLSLSPHSGTL